MLPAALLAKALIHDGLFEMQQQTQTVQNPDIHFEVALTAPTKAVKCFYFPCICTLLLGKLALQF